MTKYFKYTFLVLCCPIFGCGTAGHVDKEKDDSIYYPQVPTEIFKDSLANAWGVDKGDCSEFRLSANGYKGQALHLQWNKTTCPKINMGFGWGAWAAKDLSGIWDEAAISFQIKAADKEASVPNMVFLLGDYGEKYTAALFKAKYLSHYPLGNEWQEVQIPLNAFVKDEIDISNVKQLCLEFHGTSDIYLDEINVVKNDKAPLSSTKKYRKNITPLIIPSTIFDDKFANVWGLEKNDCRDYGYTSESYKGKRALQLTWDVNKHCEWIEFGTSWNEWRGVNMSASLASAKLEFYAQAIPGIENTGELLVGLQDYKSEKVARIPLTGKYIQGGSLGSNWTKVSIPLQAFPFAEEGINANNIKQLLFSVTGKGGLRLDEIKIVE